MFRQRLRARTSRLALLGRVIVVIFAAALLWYGLMVVLLALKVDPGTVDLLSGYRTVFDEAASLRPDHVDGSTVRLIAAAAGLLAFLLFGWLALKEVPRPYLARHDVELDGAADGEVTVRARAIERAAEVAACRHPGISAATGRFDAEAIELSVSVRRARGLADTLRDVQGRVRESLEQHGLPVVPVNVNLTGFDRRQRRELD